MRKSNSKMVIMLICMTLGFFGTATCQINTDEVLFYQVIDGRGHGGLYFLVIKPEGNNITVFWEGTTSLKRNLAKDKYIYEKGNNVSIKERYVYFPQISTPQRAVYRRSVSYGRQCWEYVAISMDYSSVIIWYEPQTNPYGERSSLITCSIISKEDYLPKSLNYDFLND